MIPTDEAVLILLAAGQSRRFGRDKLAEPFLGRPIGLHAVSALEQMPFLGRIAVVSETTLDYAARGYRVIANEFPEDGMSGSVKLGLVAALAMDARAVVIALADMPRVTATHIRRLLDSADGADTVVASSDGRRPMPPAVFGRGRFETLLALEGSAGARDLVRGGRHVVASPAELIDIDTPQDLEQLRAMFPGK